MPIFFSIGVWSSNFFLGRLWVLVAGLLVAVGVVIFPVTSISFLLPFSSFSDEAKASVESAVDDRKLSGCSSFCERSESVTFLVLLRPPLFPRRLRLLIPSSSSIPLACGLSSEFSSKAASSSSTTISSVSSALFRLLTLRLRCLGFGEEGSVSRKELIGLYDKQTKAGEFVAADGSVRQAGIVEGEGSDFKI